MECKILLEQGAWETRAVAFSDDCRPFALFLDHPLIEKPHAKYGRSFPARISKITVAQGGAFAELDMGEECFIRTKDLGGLQEGAMCHVKIAAEARRGKLARGRVSADSDGEIDLWEQWIKSLPLAGAPSIETIAPGHVEVESAFQEALASSVTLPGGGILRLTETPALIAIDIDTAGREDRGRSYDRALAVNIEAAKEAARQLSLRRLGGNVVIDCVSPLRKDTTSKIKAAFIKTFHQFCDRAVEALAPSPFGLMEAVLEWREQPISHALLKSEGKNLSSHSQLCAGIRVLEREMHHNGSATFQLDVPLDVMAEHTAAIGKLEKTLAERYGARFLIAPTSTQQPQVTKI